MTREPETGPPCVEPLIEAIRRMEESGRRWSLKAEEVRSLLGLSEAEFCRTVYDAEVRKKPLVGLSSATERFSQDNIWEFVALVELFCGSRAARELERAGIFFSHPEQVEIMSAFLGVAAEAVGGHRLQEEEFSAMLRVFGSYPRARAVYLEEYFSLPELAAEAARSYCSGRSFGIPGLALENVRRLIDFLFQKHVLDREAVFAPLEAALFARAVREGYAEAERTRPEGEPAGEPGAPEEPARRWARRAMGLDEQRLDRFLLKARYKELMKRYHPDVNPAGLRRCQEINAAYTALLAEL